MKYINSRADLEAMRGTPDFDLAIAAIYGASVRFVAVDGQWVEEANPAAYEQFGYAASDFASEVAALDLPAPTAPIDPPAPSTDTLPDLEPWRFWSMLDMSGKRSDLLTFIGNLPDPQKTVAKAKLEYSLVFRRDNDLVLQAQQALGLTDEQLDGLWAQALEL